MKKKLYRIELKSMDYLVAKDTATLAAFSNGGKYMNLHGIKFYAEVKVLEMGYKDYTVTLIGESHLAIDRGTENLLLLTEVEVMELDAPEISSQEARDILNELTAPTLHRQTGIADENNF